MPLKKQGMRMLPPMSEPTPIKEAPLPIILPSPPEKDRDSEKMVMAEKKVAFDHTSVLIV